MVREKKVLNFFQIFKFSNYLELFSLNLGIKNQKGCKNENRREYFTNK